MSARLLIITAAFGEGHNSAARNLALALERAGATTRTADPCLLGAPFSTNLLRHFYRLVTTHFPRTWQRIYQSTDNCDFSRQRLPLMRKPENRLNQLIEEFQPHGIVSTYPLYPYFLERSFANGHKRIPVFTAVTDSMEINAAWLKAPSDYWLVTDGHTRETMIQRGLPAARVIDTGFPVHPGFAELCPPDGNRAPSPFRVLYFPTAKRPHVRRISRALLESSPDVKITIVLGRNVRLLYQRACEIRDAYPGRVRLIGWTKRVPQLLASHHLAVGKAGGATVHEAIAAQCPMIIHHLVPGQEEGNLELLESIGAGCLAETEYILLTTMRALLINRAERWRQMKAALARHNRSAGAIHAARFILDRLT